MAQDLRPLQTHKRYVEVWIAPKEPFVRYEKSDEEWCRYFGIGTIEKVLEPLYDVRDERGDLVGYCRHNPVECRGRRLVLPVAPMLEWSEKIKPFEPPSYQRIELNVWNHSLNGERFLCWMVHLRDAATLVQTSFITLLDRDRKDDFVHELRKKYFKSDRYSHFIQ